LVYSRLLLTIGGKEAHVLRVKLGGNLQIRGCKKGIPFGGHGGNPALMERTATTKYELGQNS